MRVAAIDIGTNTLLMSILERNASGDHLVRDEHAIARLGAGVDAARRIGEEAIGRVLAIVDRYVTLARNERVDTILPFGTSALRDATNREDVSARIAELTGVELLILDGRTEGLLTWRGALFGMEEIDERAAVLDIGGGSTELAIGPAADLEAVSVDIGAVRLTERHLTPAPPGPATIERARRDARTLLEPLPTLPAGSPFIGVAGTVTTLGAMQIGMQGFDAQRLNGTRLHRGYINECVERFATLTVEEIAAIPQVSEGRADLILGGSVILSEALALAGREEIVVSTGGVRHGVALNWLDEAGGRSRG